MTEGAAPTITKGDPPHDLEEGRVGAWMQLSCPFAAGRGRFFPQDPRPDDICISDIANGLALDCRYAGQGRVDRFYSVAEHSALMADYAVRDGQPPEACLAVLLHDASEAYTNDMIRAVKLGLGDDFRRMENKIQLCVWSHFNLCATAQKYATYIKDLDCRIIPIEKKAIFRYPQPWAFDIYEPLKGVTIKCYYPPSAKKVFLACYNQLCLEAGRTPETWEL